MTPEQLEVESVLNDLGLHEYFDLLIEHGFDTWDNLMGIRETDMETLGIKLGHRRKLQRGIAQRRGHDGNEALFDGHGGTTLRDEENSNVAERPKRRYRRRAARDPHAPIRPDTAYVSYAKFLRQDPEVASLSFVDIAKLVGDRWAGLSADLKGAWIKTAEDERANYKDAVDQYRQTEEYRAYAESVKAKSKKKEGGTTHESPISHVHSPGTESKAYSSTVLDVESESPAESSKSPHRFPTNVAHSGSTTSSSTHTTNSTQALPSRFGSFPTSAGTSDGVDQDVSAIESIWKVISLEQASSPHDLSARIFHDDILSYNTQSSAFSNSVQLQIINPFDFHSKSMISPFIESFLQHVNIVYFLIKPADLWSYLGSVLDATLQTPNLIISIVCICIALGSQSHSAGVPDVTIMWYEHSRRYLDDCDWNKDPAVMQILALVSLFHMAQRPTTSSYYLDTAIRIGKANNFDTAINEFNQTGTSWNIEWLHVWSTMMDMNRILVLGSDANESILSPLPSSLRNSPSAHPSPNPKQNQEGAPYRFIRAGSSLVASALRDLFSILDAVQELISQHTSIPSWELNSLVQKLETWLNCLPDELLLPAVSGSQGVDQNLLKDFIASLSNPRKAELLHLYSLYFGTICLLTGRSLQSITTESYQSISVGEEEEQNAYICLNSASRLIDFCAAFFNVFPFPVFSWLPQSTLFNSALACILGIVWQRLVLTREVASREWLDRSNQSFSDALHVLEYCGIANAQCQRHYLVLQRISDWLRKSEGSAQSGTVDVNGSASTVS